MYYVGIDIGKRKHAVRLLDEDGKDVGKVETIANDADGFSRLQSVFGDVGDSVFIGLEATGHYWLALFSFLTELGFEVTVLNPLQVCAYRRSGIRKRKTDSDDARWIADYIRIGGRGATPDDSKDLAQLREITRFRASQVRQIGECKCNIIRILDRIFPEYERLFSDVFIKSSRALLAEAVTPEDFAEFDLTELSALLSKASRGRFGMDKARDVQSAANRSIGVAFLGEPLKVEARYLLDQLDLLEQQQQQLDEWIKEAMTSLDKYLTTIPGMGVIGAATILAEIGDVNRFDKPEQIVSYAGIDPTIFESGQFKATDNHMSKRGSPALRLALWQASFRVIKYDPQLKAYYQRKRDEGKAHGTAMGAVSRKLVHRIYIILKEQRPYEVRNP